MDSSSKPFLTRTLPILSWCSRTNFGAPGINSPCLNCSSSSRSFGCKSRPRSVCWWLHQETWQQFVLASDCLQCKSWVKDRNKPREGTHRKIMSEDWCVQCWAVPFLSFHQFKHLELFNVIFFLAVQHTDLQGRIYFVQTVSWSNVIKTVWKV